MKDEEFEMSSVTGVTFGCVREECGNGVDVSIGVFPAKPTITGPRVWCW